MNKNIKKIKIFPVVGFLLFFLCVSPVLAAQGVVFDDGGTTMISTASTQVSTTTVSSTATVASGTPADYLVATNTEPTSVDLDATTAAKGYVINSEGNNFSVSFPAQSLSGAATISVKAITDQLADPWKLERVSPIYQFDLSGAVYSAKNPITLKIGYGGDTTHYKRVFFYDKNYRSWRELPTTDDPSGQIVTATIALPYAEVAVFSNPSILVAGKASWYSYKKGDFSASTDFTKGSVLRVYNTANNKYVDVTINDYGPERDKFPDRILDLDKVAFNKIANKGDGVISVRVQPLYVAPDSNGKVLGISESGAVAEPDIKAAAAIITDESTGDVLWSKNADTVLPLASLSKLVAIKVFFDQNPSLDTVVTYKKQDELYNYQYCKPEESAKLTVTDGETMTIGDLVYSALVGSANNAVESLIRVSGISRDDFIAKMNSFATSVGASSTHFVEPTGLSSQNVSSPRDYAIITKEVFKNSLIEKVSVTPKYVFTTINTKKTHTLTNTNNFIRDGVFAAANNLKITGSKTGYLDQYNLMTRVAGANGEKVIAIDFGATTKAQSLMETQELLQYGLKLLAEEK
jgi:serine-type D-Ala-D-Ala endopeptidase (penicillin-binding protein 7)